MALVAVFLNRFPFGRRIYAVGSNPVASVFYGLRTERVVLLAYAHRRDDVRLCRPALRGARRARSRWCWPSGWELTSLASAVIGGVSVAGGSGTAVGAALGAVVLATIDNGLVLLRIPEFWRMFIQGAAIVAAVAIDVLIGAADPALPGGRAGPGRTLP